jgi:hypothetical protein
MKENDNGLNMWNALPEECKSLILSRLTNKEAARIARVSKEFNEGVKNVRNTVQLLVLPPDLSPLALQGLVLELSHSFYIFMWRDASKT